ncbi:uncharacterized protein TNCV_4410001 [Trichonephila clavipes]|nr:uncharacterized protein TNCV_4410001 [Trichonephila clavipes]
MDVVVGNRDGSQISCAALRALDFNSQEQLIREHWEDPELGHIYRYLENSDDGSVNATACEAPISLISDNGPQFISEVIEHLSHRLDIKHMKTVTYRPQANLTEIVHCTLVQMIAYFVEENHDNWDRFLHDFAFALHTSINETAETHFMSAAGRREVGKFMSKFEGPYRVLEVRNNNLIIWKKGKRVIVNIDQVRVYHPRQSDTISFDSHDKTLYGQRSNIGSSRSHPEKSKRSRKTSSEESKGRKSNKGNAGTGDPGLKRKGPRSIAVPSHQLVIKQCTPPTEESRARVQNDRARKTRTTPSKRNSAAERRPVRSRQATAVRP